MAEISEDDISVGLLIGANCTKALEPIDDIPSKNNGPYAIKTRLGWCIVGPVNGTQIRQGIHCHQIAVKQADAKDVGKHYLWENTISIPKLLLKIMMLEICLQGCTT